MSYCSTCRPRRSLRFCHERYNSYNNSPRNAGTARHALSVQLARARLPRSPQGGALLGSAVCRILPQAAQAILTVGNSSFRLDLRHPSEFAFCMSGHEEHECRFVRDNLTPGAVFFDIGANFGLFSAWAAEAVGPSGRCIAVEPNTKTFKHLVRFLSGAANVSCINAAASDKSGGLVVVGVPWWRVDTGGYIGRSTAGLPVPTITVDELWESLGRPNVSIMKIDTEGFEPLVLHGAKRTLESTAFVLLEASEWCMSRCGKPLSLIHDTMEGAGFTATSPETGRPLGGRAANVNIAFTRIR